MWTVEELRQMERDLATQTLGDEEFRQLDTVAQYLESQVERLEHCVSHSSPTKNVNSAQILKVDSSNSPSADSDASGSDLSPVTMLLHRLTERLAAAVERVESKLSPGDSSSSTKSLSVKVPTAGSNGGASGFSRTQSTDSEHISADSGAGVFFGGAIDDPTFASGSAHVDFEGAAGVPAASDMEAAVAAAAAAVIESPKQGSPGRGVKGVVDPIGGLARPPWDVAMRRFLRESLCELCVDPLHTRTLRAPGQKLEDEDEDEDEEEWLDNLRPFTPLVGRSVAVQKPH
jgi:hypothetical protein